MARGRTLQRQLQRWPVLPIIFRRVVEQGSDGLLQAPTLEMRFSFFRGEEVTFVTRFSNLISLLKLYLRALEHNRWAFNLSA